ncbi:MAG: hypothetical protein M1305_07730, partial [Candidatus Marsarchaeota archaeon]|nr:hypothetical protein [Candidatus Marsarchaeota archaeon]
MTSKERMNIAMRRGKPDRVPFMCQLSIGHMLKNSSVRPVEIWNSAEGFARAATECCTRYRMDGLLINVWPEDRCWRDKIESIESREEVDRVTWRDGRIVNYYTNGNVIEERADARLDIEDVLDALDA